MSKIITAITKCLNIRAYAIDSTDIVNRAIEIHKTTPVMSAALGRMLTGSSMMGSMLKSEDDTLSLQIKGSGAAGGICAVSDSMGNVRGYAENPLADLPLNSNGKLDVSGVIGSEAMLTVIKDMGMKEPYIGRIPAVSGEIAEDITAYYAQSEQTPTVCALGVLVDRDYSCKAAGGYIIQLLPYTPDDVIDRLEENIKHIKPISSMIDSKMSLQDILKEVLKGFEVEFLDERDVSYRCNCSEERTERTLTALGEKELIKIADEGETIEVCCHFCDKKYYFTPESLYDLAKNSK